MYNIILNDTKYSNNFVLNIKIYNVFYILYLTGVTGCDATGWVGEWVGGPRHRRDAKRIKKQALTTTSESHLYLEAGVDQLLSKFY